MDEKSVILRDDILTKGDIIKLLEPLPDDAVMRAFCNGCSGYITGLSYSVRLDGEVIKSITLVVPKKIDNEKL